MVGKSIRGLVALGAMLPLFLLVACGGGSPTSSESASGGVEVTEVQPSATSSPSAEGAGASPAASPSEEASSPSPTGFADIVIDGQLTNKEICNSYKKSLVAFQKSADRRVKGAEGKTKDSYDAARFRKYNQWVKVNHQEKLAESLEALATDALNEVSNGQAGLVSDLDDYLDASIDACGLSIWVNKEALIDTVIAVAGSAPAYFFSILETLIDEAHKGGLPAEDARILAVQTCLGAAKLCQQSETNLATLRNNVTSSGGTTQAALETFARLDQKVEALLNW